MNYEAVSCLLSFLRYDDRINKIMGKWKYVSDLYQEEADNSVGSQINI